MLRILSISIVCSALWLSAFLAEAKTTVSISQGQALTFNAPAKRIISLAPSITEILFAIGAGPSIVAVSTDSDYPTAAQKLPHIGGYQSFNVEALLALHPDLVIVWQGGTSTATIAQLQRLHIPVWQVNTPHLADIATAMQHLGALTGHTQEATLAAQQFLTELTDLQQRYGQKQSKIPVMMEYSELPLYVATGDSIPSQLIELCGGQNIFGTLPAPTQVVNTEQVLAANPAVIIGLSPISLNNWLAWPQLTAVQHQQLHVLDADLLARNGPRILEGAQQVCELINIPPPSGLAFQ